MKILKSLIHSDSYSVDVNSFKKADLSHFRRINLGGGNFILLLSATALAACGGGGGGGGGVATVVTSVTVTEREQEPEPEPVAPSRNEIDGDGDDNRLMATENADDIDGMVGNDTVDYSMSAAAVMVDLSASSGNEMGGSDNNDTIMGDGMANVLNGGGGNDSIAGGAGTDSIVGGAGDDTIDGGLGADTIDGGADTDTISYANAAADVTVNLVAGTGITMEGGSPVTDMIANVENVIGSANDDTITGDAMGNVITGGAGNDDIDGGGGSDTVSYADATNDINVILEVIEDREGSPQTLPGEATGHGNDTLENIENVIGGSGNDTIVGTTGNNRLAGGAGNDSIDGGDGNDTVSYEDATNGVNVNLMTGRSTGHGNDTFMNIDNAIGGSGSDTIIGNGEANRLDGGAGDDSLTGGAGNDTFVVSSGTDVITDFSRDAATSDEDMLDFSAWTRITNFAVTRINDSGSGAHSFLGNHLLITGMGTYTDSDGTASSESFSTTLNNVFGAGNALGAVPSGGDAATNALFTANNNEVINDWFGMDFNMSFMNNTIDIG